MYYCPKAGFYDETQALSDAKTYADYPQAWWGSVLRKCGKDLKSFQKEILKFWNTTQHTCTLQLWGSQPSL